jgi:hypothetical protein
MRTNPLLCVLWGYAFPGTPERDGQSATCQVTRDRCLAFRHWRDLASDPLMPSRGASNTSSLSLDPQIRQSPHIARLRSSFAMLQKNGRRLRRPRSSLASMMQLRSVYERLAERKGRPHHRRLDGEWPCLSARASCAGERHHHWTDDAGPTS